MASSEVDTMLRDLLSNAFAEEDAPVIKACYLNLEGGDLWDGKPVFLGVGANGVRARRIIETRVAREKQQAMA